MITTADHLYFQIRVCAWCGADMGKKECVRAADGQITDGVCKPCGEKQLAELAAYRASKSQKTAA